ncbi:MAG: VCBS repeat-containing protein [Planctomycetes bacterium]|nr:VCBS repeat-containing protein [Planctomycetota bacterium]
MPYSDLGFCVLGNLDLNGDGGPDVLASTYSSISAEVFAYDTKGNLLYAVPCLAQGRYPVSLCKMGDMNADGCDDFLIGCIDGTSRGCQMLISGRTGTTIRETFGLLPGDQTAMHASNLGDIDGDGVDDYAAFPWYSSARYIAVAYSGASGAVIRSWTDYANSVVTGLDFDQDGVNDIVTGADWGLGPSLYGRSYCWSGRDGSELWRVDVVPFPPGTGSNGQNWMWKSAALGSSPTNPYPALAWMDEQWYTIGTSSGRVRVFDGARLGQGPVTGTACTSSGTLPLIGVRKLGTGLANTGFRTTVAKTHPNALAALLFAFTPLPAPVDLTPLGFTACTLYVDPVATFLQFTGTAGIDLGYAAVDLPHPLSAAATGTNVLAQWIVLDPANGAYAATQRHAIRLP